MILHSLQIDHFGVWNGLKIGHLESGVNLFYGPNEVGKTTLMQFIRAIFYGFNSARLAYGMPDAPLDCGGALLFSGSNGTFRMRRHVVEYPTDEQVTLHPELPFYQQESFLKRYRTQKWEDGLEIYNEAGIQEAPFALKKELGMTASLEADERRFSGIFAIGLQELQQLSVLEATEAASRLYHLSTGLERHAFQALCQELEEERQYLLRPEDAMSRLHTEEIPFLRDVKEFCMRMLAVPQTRTQQGWILQRLQTREILLHELENIRLQQKGYRQLKQAKEALRGELEELESELKQQEHQRHVLVVAQSLQDVWFQRVEAEEMLVKLLDGLSPEESSESALEKLRESDRLLQKNEIRRKELKAERERLFQERIRLREALGKSTVSSAFWRMIPQLESLLQQEEWVETLRHRREEKKRAIRDAEAQLAVDYRRLGLKEPDFSAGERNFLPDAHQVRSLRAPMQEVRKLSRIIQKEGLKKKEFLRQAEEKELRIQHYLDSLPSRLGNLEQCQKGIPGLAKEPVCVETFREPGQMATFLGEIASKLRRQELNLQHLIQSLLAEKSMAGEYLAAKAKETLPLGWLLGLGGVFVTGMTLMLFETVRLLEWIPPQSHALSLFFFIVGTLLWMGCVGIQWRRQRQVTGEVGRTEGNLHSLRQQIQRVAKNLFPEQETPILHETLQVLTAEAMDKVRKTLEWVQEELPLAEEHLALSSQREALRLEVRHHTRRLQKLCHERKQAILRRREALENAGLPTEWKGRDLQRWREGVDRLDTLWRTRTRDLESEKQYALEWQLYTQRWRDSLQAAGEEVETVVLTADFFQKYREKIRQAQNGRNRQQEIFRERRGIRKSLRNLGREFRQKQVQRREILQKSGLPHEKDFPLRLERLEELTRWRGKRRELQKTVEERLHFACSESTLWEIYEHHTPEQLAEKIRLLEVRLEENRFQKEALEKRTRETETTLQQMETDTTSNQLQYTLRQTERQIVHAIHYWRVNALTSRLLETLKKTYEQKRQPATLARTSEYLQKMTRGKYLRVWTPVDEDVLFVEREDGKILGVEQLSCGTREVLFLAIRLALIGEYNAQGLWLPVVLDDVLVNLDRQRMEAAVDVLTEFVGDSRQILFFTAHEHIREMFLQREALLCDMTAMKGK